MLRRNDFGAIVSKIETATVEACVPAEAACTDPIILRDAARTLAAVAE
jgi:hypothetical protein